MANYVLILLVNVLIYMVADWKELRKARRRNRWLYVSIMVVTLVIGWYLYKTNHPFRPGNWIPSVPF